MPHGQFTHKFFEVPLESSPLWRNRSIRDGSSDRRVGKHYINLELPEYGSKSLERSWSTIAQWKGILERAVNAPVVSKAPKICMARQDSRIWIAFLLLRSTSCACLTGREKIVEWRKIYLPFDVRQLCNLDIKTGELRLVSNVNHPTYPLSGQPRLQMLHAHYPSQLLVV